MEIYQMLPACFDLDDREFGGCGIKPDIHNSGDRK